MQRVLPPSRSLPLFGVQRTREIEQRAREALPPHTLMRRAGLAVARLALAVAPHARRVWIAAGPGNNGGDGFEAALHLRAAGKHVLVTVAGVPERMPADALDALARAREAGVAIAVEAPDDLGPADLAIDALLGIGATRAPDPALAQTIARLNTLPCPVLSIDLPSGLHGGTGQPLGENCVRAQHCLTLLTVKPGLFTAAGRDHAGVVWFDDLSVTIRSDAPDAWLIGGDSAALGPRSHVQHKGSFGDVAVVGGAPGMTGAALLAARAAHAAGAGRTFVSLLDEHRMTHDPLRPELMFRDGWWKSAEATLRHATVVCGCGGGDAVREALPRLFSAAGRLVLDADALNAIAGDPKLQTLLRSRSQRGRPTVMTPHPLEAARLMSFETAKVQADRLGAAQSLADDFGTVVLLKGSGTVVATPGAIPYINATGTAALATAGTGDVLAGWLGGLWAQQPQNDGMAAALRVTCAAVFRHGAAADACTSPALRAGDLIDSMLRLS
ncbi:NAD(P)H-hydrate dehydratase [Piscinibacter sp. XHJ-5]|uniref:NAD(P)H-hydrate dehydratase n=1 Tax=Piscinibacter sp. XHJ-5 TaxID=3037797 RepID=UPI002452F06E|nr:NAD(P)H-hydrate dehydratase [Piscinibacter sp. XHJ-5]